jgi:type IV pilus assembly protein PilM
VSPPPILQMSHKRVLGIHLGPAQIKVAEIERTKSGPVLLNLLWDETPAEAFVGNRIENPTALAHALMRMLQAHKVRTKIALTTIDGNEVISRTIIVPMMPIREMRKSILFEAEAALPVQEGNTMLDYQVLRTYKSEEDGSEGAEVFILSAPRPPLGMLTETLLHSGLKPVAIDLTPIAAQRAEQRTGQVRERGGDYILITINDRCTDLSIVHDGHMRIMRSLPIGSINLCDAIGERHLFDTAVAVEIEEGMPGAPPPEDLEVKEEKVEGEVASGQFGEDPFSSFGAEPAKPVYTPSSADQDELVKLQPLITELVDETLNTIRFGQSFGKEKTEVDFAVLDGYFPHGDRFIRSMADKLGLPVLKGMPLEGIQVGNPEIKTDLLDRFAPDFAACIGLGLRGVDLIE